MKLETFIKALFGGFIAFMMVCAAFWAPIACAVSDVTYPEALRFSLIVSIVVAFLFAFQSLNDK
jgi:hypothetical protein